MYEKNSPCVLIGKKYSEDKAMSTKLKLCFPTVKQLHKLKF